MGSQCSQPQDQFTQILSNFTVLPENEHYEDPIYGECILLESLAHKNLKLICKVFHFDDQKQFYEELAQWAQRHNIIKNNNIVSIQSIQHMKCEGVFVENYKIKSVQHILMHTNYSKWSEYDLQVLLDSMVNALSFFQNQNITHQGLNFERIYISSGLNDQKHYKIADPTLFNLPSNLSLFGKNNIYISPEQFTKQMNNFNPYKSDVFVLGIILLHLALGTSLDTIYNKEYQVIDSHSLMSKQSSAFKNFTPEFQSVLRQMLSIDHYHRPDFNELDYLIDQVLKIPRNKDLPQLVLIEQQNEDNEEQHQTIDTNNISKLSINQTTIIQQNQESKSYRMENVFAKNQFISDKSKIDELKSTLKQMDLRKSRVKEEDDNGNVYQGDKLDGMKHGYGIYTQPDGLVYEGYFASDMQEGQGKQNFKQTITEDGKDKIIESKIYEGTFKSGQWSGQGIQYNLNSEYLNYSWNINSIDFGNFWKKYTGSFKDGKWDEFGIVELSNGESFNGYFSDGVANGNGTFIGQMGRISGVWTNNNLVSVDQQ